MTTMTYTKHDIKRSCLNTITINGRSLLASRVTSIAPAGAGKWVGEASGYPFTIIGGRASGGAENEWFVQWELDGDHDFIPVKSAKAAIEYIEGM